MSEPPLWQRVVLGAQARVNPLLRAAVDNEDVAATIALLQVTRTTLTRATEAPSRRVLHLLNLPAASDVNRLLVQLAHLEREVRGLRNRLEDTQDDVTGPYS